MKNWLIGFLLFTTILLAVYWSLFTNIGSSLPDRFDYPYITWIFGQNIYHLKSFNFAEIFSTNAFAPHQNTMFFSDLLLPQSILGLVISFFSSNILVVFNVIFFLTLILDYLASYLFWGSILNNPLTTFVAAIITVFSPFYYMEKSHFQMISYWPMMFGLYTLRKRKYVWTGVWFAIQFVASAYLGIFSLAMLGLYILIVTRKEQGTREMVLAMAKVLTIFTILTAPFLLGYRATQKQYNIKRPYQEYVIYSAHISDYLFTEKIDSFVNRNGVMNKWNAFNHHMGGASSPGIVLSLLAILYIVRLKKDKSKISLTIKWDLLSAFFIACGVIGLIFSLGPRMSFNGTYAWIPLPYHIVLKLVPLVASLRTTARWSMLFYLAVIYFGVSKLGQVHTRSRATAIILSLLLILEFVPRPLSAVKLDYLKASDDILKPICSQADTTILHVPVTHLAASGGIAEGLSYITTRELASLDNKCKMVNGYSGYDMPEIFAIEERVNQALDKQDTKALETIAKETGAKVIVFNRKWIKSNTEFLKNQQILKQITHERLETNEVYYILD